MRPSPAACLTLVVAAMSACSPPVTVESISVGPGRSCGLADDGLICWGGSDAWNSDETAPPQVDLASVSLGTVHACGLDEGGHAHCWGPAAEQVITVPDDLVEVAFARLAAGHDFNCGIRRDDGSLACWGINPVNAGCGLDPEGECGGQLDPPVGDFVDLSFGDSFYGFCALDTDGRAACWGGAIDDTPPLRFLAIGAGASHACGVVDDESVVCWGAARGDPWIEPPDGRFADVTAGFNHSCGLTTEGRAICWGAGPAVDAPVPDDTFVAIDAGAHQTCGLTAAGFVSCWGLDSETGAPSAGP